jgi:hypothetical protein
MKPGFKLRGLVADTTYCMAMSVGSSPYQPEAIERKRRWLADSG